jgi:hypothetical protein
MPCATRVEIHGFSGPPAFRRTRLRTVAERPPGSAAPNWCVTHGYRSPPQVRRRFAASSPFIYTATQSTHRGAMQSHPQRCNAIPLIASQRNRTHSAATQIPLIAPQRNPLHRTATQFHSSRRNAIPLTTRPASRTASTSAIAVSRRFATIALPYGEFRACTRVVNSAWGGGRANYNFAHIGA